MPCSLQSLGQKEGLEVDSEIERKRRFWIRIIITAVILAASLYIILSKSFGGDAEKWAYATAAVVVGYWFRDSNVL